MYLNYCKPNISLRNYFISLAVNDELARDFTKGTIILKNSQIASLDREYKLLYIAFVKIKRIITLMLKKLHN